MKYYTPEISEFFVGFEYEFREGENWRQLIYTLELTIIGRVLDGLVRVKYLDKEDIEGLGFKHLGALWFRKDSCLTLGGKNFLNCVIRKWSNTELDIYSLDTNDDIDTLIFRGNIKNKSELRKVLQMLNIQ